MEHNNTHGGLLLVAGSWFFNLLAILDKNTVSFILGSVVSVLAIVHYGIQIRNNIRKRNEPKS
jgi:hypothetical protein